MKNEFRIAIGSSQRGVARSPPTRTAAGALLPSSLHAAARAGRQFQQFAPNDLADLKDAFLAIIPDEGRLFQPHVERCDADSLVIHLEACPLKDAWEELGLDDHDKAIMCEIAEEVDKGTFEAAGFAFTPDTCKPGRTGCCHLNIYPKS